MDLYCNSRVIDITPTEPLYLAGFANRTVPSTGIHMPLSSRCLILRTEEDFFCIISNDFMETKKATIQTIKEALFRATSIPQDHIFVHSIHTHSAPIMDGMGMATNKANESYANDAISKIIANAVSTFEDEPGFRKSTLHLGRTDSFIAANRRHLDKSSGKVIISTKDSILEDPTVGIVQFIDNKKQILATLINYACHPVTLGPQSTLISPDFVGKTREIVEKEWGGPCLFLNGAAGDINPKDGPRTDIERTNKIGTSLGKTVLDCDLFPVSISTVNFSRGSVKLPFEKQKIDMDFIKTETAKKKAMKPGFMGWNKKIDLWAIAQNKRIGLSETLGRELEINVLRFGDIIFLFTPGELFSSYHSILKTEFPEYEIFLIGYTNGESGYLPNKKAFELGGYEVEQAYVFFDEPSPLFHTSEEIYIKEAKRLINKVLFK